MTDNDDGPDVILALVGNERRVIALDLFLGVFDQIASELRARGLCGHALDVEIDRLLPRRLQQTISGVTIH